MIKKSLRQLKYYLDETRRIIPLLFSKKTPVFVYQMGRVGSRSIVDSITRATDRPLVHLHCLNPDHIKQDQTRYIPPDTIPDYTLETLLYYMYLPLKKPTQFISLVRDPVATNVSAFFYNFYEFTGRENINDYDLEALKSIFLETYQHKTPLLWFDREIKKTLKIDVYSERFRKNLGVQSYAKDNFELLILQSDLPDSKKSSAIETYLQVEPITIRRKNTHEETDYSEKYRAFKNTVTFSRSYLDSLYQAKYTSHFFSSEQIKGFYEKWSS